MSISGINNSGLHAAAAGWRAQLDAQTMRQALEVGGLGNAAFDKALSMIEQQGQAVAEAGFEHYRHSVQGRLIDLLA